MLTRMIILYVNTKKNKTQVSSEKWSKIYFLWHSKIERPLKSASIVKNNSKRLEDLIQNIKHNGLKNKGGNVQYKGR